PPVDPGLNRAARELNLEFPIGHAYGARVELRVRRTVGVIEKRRDDVSRRFRIRRQPASEERVPGGDSTAAPAAILGAAQPSHRGLEVLAGVAGCSRPSE